jgi:RNA recognition motif-containing protein
MKLYVGNLPNSITEDELRASFKVFGEVQSLKMITDRDTGKPKGFGFIEMSDNAARNAIKGLNDTEMLGRNIIVNEAQEKRFDNNNRRSY